MTGIRQTERRDARWAVWSWAMVLFSLALSAGLYLAFAHHRAEAAGGLWGGAGGPAVTLLGDLFAYLHPAVVLLFFRLAVPGDRFGHIAACIGAVFLAAVGLVVVLPSIADGGDGAFISLPLTFFCCYFAVIAAVRVALRKIGDTFYLCRLFGLVLGPPLVPFLLFIREGAPGRMMW